MADLTQVLLNIENEIRTQRKLIDSQERRDVYAAGEAAIRDIEASSGSKPTGLWSLIDKGIVTETLSPLRQVRRMTGYVKDSPLTKVTQELADGQRAMFDYQRKAEAQFAKYTGDKGFTKSIAGPKARGIQIQGLGKDGPATVTITPAMRASLYLHSLNDQNLRHIRDGGITVPDWKLYQKGQIAEAYARGTTIRLTPSQVRHITANMTQKERAFALAAHRYFNVTSKEAINAVSEKLKGYSIAQEENYFPIRTDSSFTRAEFESIKRDGTIEGMGFLKERVNAANPILLRDMSAELSQSIQMHSKYAGLAIPVRNFNKLWNVSTGKSVEQASEGAWTGARPSAEPRSGSETRPSRREGDRAPWPVRSSTMGQWVDGGLDTGYNGSEGGDSYGQDSQGISGDVLQDENIGSDAGTSGTDTAGPGRIAAWAEGAQVQNPGEHARKAVKIVQSYGVRAVVVREAAIRGQNPRAVAMAENGVVYLPDTLTEDDAETVAHHEIVHVLKQLGSAAYEEFLENTGGELDFHSKRAKEVIGIVTFSRFHGQDFMSQEWRVEMTLSRARYLHSPLSNLHSFLKSLAVFPRLCAMLVPSIRKGVLSMEDIIVALITGGLALLGTLAGTYTASRKNAALIAYRLEQLERKVQAHNNLVERMYQVEERTELQEEKLKVANHRIEDLEDYQRGGAQA